MHVRDVSLILLLVRDDHLQLPYSVSYTRNIAKPLMWKQFWEKFQWRKNIFAAYKCVLSIANHFEAYSINFFDWI